MQRNSKDLTAAVVLCKPTTPDLHSHLYIQSKKLASNKIPYTSACRNNSTAIINSLQIYSNLSTYKYKCT